MLCALSQNHNLCKKIFHAYGIFRPTIKHTLSKKNVENRQQKNTVCGEIKLKVFIYLGKTGTIVSIGERTGGKWGI